MGEEAASGDQLLAKEWTATSEQSTAPVVSQHTDNVADIFDLGGRTLKMVTAVWYPFVIRHQNASSTWYTGLCIDLLDILVSGLNFTFTITEPPDQIWGIQLPNGTWAGMTGMLHRKEVDFALAGLSVTADRATVSDHTTGFFYDEVVLVASRPDPVRAVWTFFLHPFHWLIYGLLAGGLVVVTALWVFLDRWRLKMSPCSSVAEDGEKEWSAASAVADAVFALFGALIARGTVLRSASGSGRVLLCSWLLLSVVMVGTYTGKLTASALLIKPPLPFSSLRDLVTRSDYTWGLSRGTMMDSYFSNSSIPDYRLYYEKMLEFAQEDPDIMSSDFEEVIVQKLLTEKYVFMAPQSYYRILKMQHCQLTVVQERLFQDMLAIHLQKGSPYTALFNRILTRAKEQGLLEYLTRKWLYQQSDCQGDEAQVKSVSLDLVLTAFILAAAGVALAAILLTVECLLARGRQG